MGMATAWAVYVAIILSVRMAVIVLAVGAVNMGFLLHKAYSGM